jgi:hypothetical protein
MVEQQRLNIGLNGKMAHALGLRKSIWRLSVKVGDSVKYSNDKTCVGVIVAIGSNMFKVKWNKEGAEEWMPEYALELISESR